MRVRQGIIAAAVASMAVSAAAVAATPRPGGHYTARTANGIAISLRVSPRGKTIRASVVCRGSHRSVTSLWMTIRRGHFVGFARQPGAPPSGSIGPAYAISGRFRTRSKITGLLYNDAICNSNEKRYTARLVAR